MIKTSDISNAYQNIKNDIDKTPLLFSPALSKLSGAKVYLKMEHLQRTGSFKIRGVLNKIISLQTRDFEKLFVAASTGNHAAAFGYAAEKFKFKGTLFLPEKTNETKVKAIAHYDLEKVFFGDNSRETEAKATAHAREVGGVLIHPYNDRQIIIGQGTLGLEIKQQLPQLDVVLAPVGGGGLASGLSTFFAEDDTVSVVGCQPKNASEMYDSIENGHIVPSSTKETIADASAGGVEENALTFEICKKHLSGFELLDEEDIKKAVAFVLKYHQSVIEPAAALPVAALLRGKKYRGKHVVLVLTGKKISMPLLTTIVNTYGDYY
ncbi:pyridoxal-phosphate dependent enzyme [Spongiimicrobium sp. 3-5]|uniref:pyridoxal-phosphate dependent enzyme n=1 Tax=Spongiimicrobium sp. 3-5 TaxID=3332596 RepID=UPI0039801C81